MWGWLWSLKTKWQGWYWDRQDFQWLARQCLSLKEASGWNQSLAQCALGRRKGVVWKESKRSSFALTRRFCSWCDPLPASTYQCDKALNSLAKLADQKCISIQWWKMPLHVTESELRGFHPISLLTHEAVEAQREKGTYPRSHSWWGAVRTINRISKPKSKVISHQATYLLMVIVAQGSDPQP